MQFNFQYYSPIGESSWKVRLELCRCYFNPYRFVVFSESKKNVLISRVLKQLTVFLFCLLQLLQMKSFFSLE